MSDYDQFADDPEFLLRIGEANREFKRSPEYKGKIVYRNGVGREPRKVVAQRVRDRLDKKAKQNNIFVEELQADADNEEQ